MQKLSLQFQRRKPADHPLLPTLQLCQSSLVLTRELKPEVRRESPELEQGRGKQGEQEGRGSRGGGADYLAVLSLPAAIHGLLPGLGSAFSIHLLLSFSAETYIYLFYYFPPLRKEVVPISHLILPLFLPAPQWHEPDTFW